MRLGWFDSLLKLKYRESLLHSILKITIFHFNSCLNFCSGWCKVKIHINFQSLFFSFWPIGNWKLKLTFCKLVFSKNWFFEFSLKIFIYSSLKLTCMMLTPSPVNNQKIDSESLLTHENFYKNKDTQKNENTLKKN